MLMVVVCICMIVDLVDQLDIKKPCRPFLYMKRIL